MNKMKNKDVNPLLKSIEARLGGREIKWDEQDIAQNPAGYSLLSKLIHDTSNDTFNNDGSLNNTTPNLDYLLGMASEKAQDIDDNEAIMQLLPDLVRAAQILISYTLSPAFILKPELMYYPPENLFTQTIGKQMVDEVKHYMNVHCSLDGKLFDIMYKILFTKGAYAVAVIPEASLDELINPELAKESFSQQLAKQDIRVVNEALDTYMRPCYGFSGKATKPKSSSKNKVNLSIESYHLDQIEIGHGNTGNHTVKHKDTAMSQESLTDTRIFMQNDIHFDLPKEVIQAHRDSDKIEKLGLSKEGRWTINLIDKQQKSVDTLIEFTDDLSLIRQGSLRKDLYSEQVNRKLGLSRESFQDSENFDDTDRSLLTKLFKSMDRYLETNNQDSNQLKVLKSGNQTLRKDLNEPLILEYPIEAIAPIFKPGSPSEHVGYLALHDEEGAPLSKVKPVNYYRDLTNQFNTRNNSSRMASSLIQQGRQMFEGLSGMLDESRQLEILSRIHGNAIIKEILERLRQGESGKNLDIGDATEAFRIMYYRALRGQRTRILFIPKEIMTYMAHGYDNKGMGKSMIDNMKVLLSLRIQYMLAQIRAGIMNSIPETVATVKIDEKDPDPSKTLKIASALMLKSRQNAGLLVGTSNVQTIEDRINQSNIRIAIESDHPKVPNIGHDISRNTADIPTPDNDTGDLINRLVSMGTFLPPELIDNSYGVDFAREIIQQNFLVGLVVTQIQSKQNPFFTDFVKKVILASPSLRKNLKKVVSGNREDLLGFIKEAADEEIDIKNFNKKELDIIDNYIVDKFIKGILVMLPEVTDDNEDAKAEEITKREARIDKVIENLFSADALPAEIAGEETGALIESYGKTIKADMMRNFLIETGYGSEVLDYLTMTDKGEQTFERNKELREIQIRALKAVAEYFQEGKNIAKSVEAVLGANEVKPAEGGGYSGGNDYGSNEDSSEGDGGDMDFGMGDDEPGWDEPSGEEDPSTTSEEKDGNKGATEEKDGAAD